MAKFGRPTTPKSSAFARGELCFISVSVTHRPFTGLTHWALGAPPLPVDPPWPRLTILELATHSLRVVLREPHMLASTRLAAIWGSRHQLGSFADDDWRVDRSSQVVQQLRSTGLSTARPVTRAGGGDVASQDARPNGPGRRRRCARAPAVVVRWGRRSRGRGG